MAFEGGTAYAESDADDEYERSMGGHSPVGDSEASPIDSEISTSTEHTPTTYGRHSSADRLPETIISEWTVDECADFISNIGLSQYADRFIGKYGRSSVSRGARATRANLTAKKTKSSAKLWWPCFMTISRAWASPVSATD